MNGGERRKRWKNLKQRLGFNGMGCCGASWNLSASTITIIEEAQDQDQHVEQEMIMGNVGQIPAVNNTSLAYVGQIPAVNSRSQAYAGQIPAVNTTSLAYVGQIIPAGNSASLVYVGQIPTPSGMNLATALAAERNLRSVRGAAVGPTETGPFKSLKRLIEEADGLDWKRRKEDEGGSDGVCCVCMERNKGAAFIPCGHTFCRVCSRELWMNRGSCPICNRSIIEILDIF